MNKVTYVTVPPADQRVNIGDIVVFEDHGAAILAHTGGSQLNFIGLDSGNWIFCPFVGTHVTKSRIRNELYTGDYRSFTILGPVNIAITPK